MSKLQLPRPPPKNDEHEEALDHDDDDDLDALSQRFDANVRVSGEECLRTENNVRFKYFNLVHAADAAPVKGGSDEAQGGFKTKTEEEEVNI